jgi:hypothetical protein
MKGITMNSRLEAMLTRAYTLAAGALDNQIDHALAEEVSGEFAELLALINDDDKAFQDPSCTDPEVLRLSLQLKGE